MIKKVSKHTGKTIKETASKIVGVSYVDSMRLRNLIKDHLSKYISTDQLGYDIFAIGEHGPSMVPLIDHIHIGDRVIDSILSESEIQHVRQDTILRGNDIIKLTGASSVLGPSHAAVYMIDKIVKSNESIIPASVWDGTRAIGRVAKFVDCSFHSIIDVNMSDREKELLYRSQDNIDIYYQNLFGKD
ncbi:MAG: hypothetical protein EOP45_03405 [Sphingobacteriaceae bacterium]|nr:MAG: hypothetical protein EOP45_03405 [Sphingobacteriaceae bacterium]